MEFSVGNPARKLGAAIGAGCSIIIRGHAPVLIFDDDDLDKALDLLVAHKFRNSGQVCVSPPRDGPKRSSTS
jgi:succinate-semialdehyde dehydrogenase/glutarate-semialdehyde dehydrogenase